MSNIIEKQTDILNNLLNIMVNSIDGEYDSCSCLFEYDHDYQDGSTSTGAELSYILNQENKSIGIRQMGVVDSLIRELHELMKNHTGGDWKEFILSLDENGRA
ncbi:hypothetical protein KG346_003742, partial [Acinetobacter baumannii]|nr:hypothetical protein [Acinetobacter baumannii]EKX6746660.1 hypothetical protein [Acinetobacter baumannii]